VALSDTLAALRELAPALKLVVVHEAGTQPESPDAAE
jgi:hypothetical protein